MIQDVGKRALALHKRLKGKIVTQPKIKVTNINDLSFIYTPGVAAVSAYVQKHKNSVGSYTVKNNFVAVVSDGSAVLGLGNVGPEAALPVMEGKCLLFKHFANIDAVPIVLSTQDPQKIIDAVLAIAPTFGGINLEDIAAPKCFEIESTLKKKLDIPVVHDDQWGAAVVALAALLNALRIVSKKLETAKIVVSGAGAAGTAIVKILYESGARNILVCDRQGIIHKTRSHNHHYKEEIASLTNFANQRGTLADAFKKSDVFIGVSSPNIVSKEMVRSMNKKPIIFGMANPIPEIMPEDAEKAGAYIMATGRSDYPNQVNNSLAFPGIFRGALDHKIKKITSKMLIRAAKNLAGLIKNPTPQKIIPSIFDKGVVRAVSAAIC